VSRRVTRPVLHPIILEAPSQPNPTNLDLESECEQSEDETFRNVNKFVEIDLIFGVLAPHSAISLRPVLVVEEANISAISLRPV
jgi:hypothetical protein